MIPRGNGVSLTALSTDVQPVNLYELRFYSCKGCDVGLHRFLHFTAVLSGVGFGYAAIGNHLRYIYISLWASGGHVTCVY
jgi:hypothetical protein